MADFSQLLGLTSTFAGAGLGAIGGILGGFSSRRKRRRRRRALRAAQGRADDIISRITAEGSTFDQARSFIDRTLGDPGSSPFAENAARGIRQSQAARGLFSGDISAIQEGVGRSAAAQSAAERLLPIATGLDAQVEGLRQNLVSGFFSNTLTAEGGERLGSDFENALGGFLSGAGSGAQIGSAVNNLIPAQAQEAQPINLASVQQASANLAQTPIGNAADTPLQAFLNQNIV